MYTPSNMLRKYLDAEQKDMYAIRVALEGELNADPGFRTGNFDEAIQYVLKHGVSKEELFEPFDPGKEMEKDQEKWDEKYYALATVRLTDNFCPERIEHIKKVAGKVYPAPASEKPSSSRTAQGKASDQKEETHRNRVAWIIVGVVVLAALITLIVFLVKRK